MYSAKRYEESPKNRAIKFVGKTPRRRDNFFNSSLVWGPGEVIMVPDFMADEYIKYPDVWAEVDKAGKLLEDQYRERCLAAKLPPVLLGEDVQKPADKEPGDEVPADILKIAEVIKSLDKKAFGKNGKPKIAAVRAALDDSVTTDELNAAWKVING